MTASEEEWMSQRTNMCGRGRLIHFILLGWAGFFLTELVIRYIGHQGASNFFLAKSKYPQKNPDDPIPKNFKPKTIPNWPNVLDAVCILFTVLGVFLTEFSMGVQVLNANISLLKTQGDPGWTFLTPTGPRVLKFLRLFVVFRVAYRVIPMISSIPIVAVILRGFRGSSTITVAFLLLCLMVFFFALLGKELFLYYGPEQGCNECLDCEQVGVVQKCFDVCSNVPFEGCSVFSSEATCNPHMCAWIPPSIAAMQSFEAKLAKAQNAVDIEDPGSDLEAAALEELSKVNATLPNGKCRFDKAKGGRCRANLSQNHFRAILTFDSLTEGMQLLFDIVIGSNWYANTVEGVETMGTVGMTYFILFFYITNYQFLRLFVCIIAANYELNEDEKLQAQEIILMYEFEQAKDRPTSDYYKEYSTEKLDQNFNPVGAYDEFSFNKHYMNLLRGAKLSLRELLDAQSGDLSSLMPPPVEDEDPNKGKLYESDSEDEEEDPRIVYYETDQIATQLTINKVKKEAMKNVGGAYDDSEPTLLERAKVQVNMLINTSSFGLLILITVMLSIGAILVSLPEDVEQYSSLAFLAIFVLEMLLKWFAMGLFGPTGSFYYGHLPALTTSAQVDHASSRHC